MINIRGCIFLEKKYMVQKYFISTHLWVRFTCNVQTHFQSVVIDEKEKCWGLVKVNQHSDNEKIYASL